MPIVVERANERKPHAELCADTPTACAPAPTADDDIHIYMASTVCYIPDRDLKVAKFLTVKKERLVNAFQNVMQPHPVALTGLPLVGLRLQIYDF